MSTLRSALSGLPDGVFADLYDRDEAYLVVIDVPGATRDSVDLRIKGGRATVDVTRPKDIPEGFEYLTEERPVFLDVTFPLPPDVKEDEVSATMNRGVLEIRLPRHPDGGRTIPIE